MVFYQQLISLKFIKEYSNKHLIQYFKETSTQLEYCWDTCRSTLLIILNSRSSINFLHLISKHVTFHLGLTHYFCDRQSLSNLTMFPHHRMCSLLVKHSDVSLITEVYSHKGHGRACTGARRRTGSWEAGRESQSRRKARGSGGRRGRGEADSGRADPEVGGPPWPPEAPTEAGVARAKTCYHRLSLAGRGVRWMSVLCQSDLIPLSCADLLEALPNHFQQPHNDMAKLTRTSQQSSN